MRPSASELVVLFVLCTDTFVLSSCGSSPAMSDEYVLCSFAHRRDPSSNPKILVEVFAEGMVGKTRVG